MSQTHFHSGYPSNVGSDLLLRVKYGAACIAMGYEDLMPFAADALLNNERQQSPEEDEDEDENREQLGLLESLRDTEVTAAAPSQDHDSWPPLIPPPMAYDNIPQPLPSANNVSNRDARIWPRGSSWPPPLDPTTRLRVSRSETQQREPNETITLESGLRVTMDYEHDVGWPEDPTALSVLGDRQRRNLASLSHLQSFDSGDADPWDPRYTSTWSRLRRGPRTGARQTRSCGVQTGGSSKAAGDVTQVFFEIKEGKTKVAMKFDPPL